MWSEREFVKDNLHAQVHYRLDKSRAARWLDRWRLQVVIRYAAFLVITSAVIQLATLPLMVFYFNRVSPAGLVANVAAGLLTGALMVGAVTTIVIGPLSAGLAAAAARVVTALHYLLVNLIAPFAHIPGATFRVAQYNGPKAAIYFVYFIPVAVLAVLLDRWRPVDVVLEVDRGAKARLDGPGDRVNIAMQRGRDKSEPRTRDLGGLLPFAARSRISAKGLAWATTLIFVVCFVVVLRPLGSPVQGNLRINFLDVGQGDSALVTFPHGATMLIDGGGEIHIRRPKSATASVAGSVGTTPEESDPDREAEFNDSGFSIGEAVVSRFLWSIGLDHLDYVLATHAHEDHTGGLSEVFQNFSVGELLVGHVPPSDGTFRRLKRSAEKSRIPIGTVSAGQGFELDGVKIEVFWPGIPGGSDSGKAVTSGNNDSVVLRLSYGSVSIVMTGDIEQPAEQSLAESGIDLHADLLKVPHHGSKTSSTDEFLDRVQPKYAVVSVGIRSRFGHPNKEVVDRYLQRGIKLYW
ncbi:MAG TPA: ComEC/Rec2 family competence protein, partial [Blastocatellia bacterium]